MFSLDLNANLIYITNQTCLDKIGITHKHFAAIVGITPKSLCKRNGTSTCGASLKGGVSYITSEMLNLYSLTKAMYCSQNYLWKQVVTWEMKI